MMVSVRNVSKNKGGFQMKKLVSVLLTLVLVCACSIGAAESKGQLVITFPKDETPNYTSALKEFVTGYKNVSSRMGRVD